MTRKQIERAVRLGRQVLGSVGVAAEERHEHGNGGGSTAWKWQTAAAWSKLAHSLGLTCHIGRAGSIKRVEQAAAAEADSLDSCLPLWSSEMLDRWIAALARAKAQLSLFSSKA